MTMPLRFRLAAGLALLAAAPAAALDEPTRPNVVLCMADDQGYGDVGYHGDPVPRTPVLDAMAASGLRLDHFYAAAPVCSPTRGSVLTGRHPDRFGCFRWGYTLRPEEVTIAEALKSAGYATGHFGKWHLGSVRRDGPNNPGASGFDAWLSAPNFYDNDPILSREGVAVPIEGESSMIAVDAALDFIRDASRRDQPFLAVVWFGSPHLPHRATAETQEPYAGQSEFVRNYYGEITGIDRAMGRLRDELRALGVADETLVWYTSDNGAKRPGSTGGLRGQKGDLYEGGLRVPAILEWPSVIDVPRTSDLPAGTVDILPTVLELAGVEPPGRPLDGVSLVPLIEGRMTERPRPLGFWDVPSPGRSTPSAEMMADLLAAQRAGEPEPDLPPPPTAPAERVLEALESGSPLPGHAAWVDGRHKLHRIPRRGDRVAYELYDLEADPTESADLADREPDRVASMAAALDAWMASVARSLRGDDDR